MRKLSLTAVVIGGVITANANAAITPRIDIGQTSISQSITNSFTDTDTGEVNTQVDELSVDLTSFGLGLTFSGDILFLDLSNNGVIESAESSISTNQDFDSFQYNFNGTYDIERDDTAITVGAALENGLTIFGGLKHGRTTVARTSYDWSLTDYDGQVFVGGSSDEYPYSDTSYVTQYDGEGYFLGASYFFTVGDIAGLTLSAAYTSQSAFRRIRSTYVNEFDANTGEAIFEDDFDQEDLDSANGISLSATLTFDYIYIKAETQSYVFEDKDDSGLSVDIEESVARISIGVRL